jgi:hypothetical protein
MSVVQVAVANAAIALSAFSLITYLWLGLTVLLLGNRHALVTWVGGVGLLIAAIFFLCHGALVGAGETTGAGPADVWWHLSWLPAFAAPVFWATIGLHYVGEAGVWGRLRRMALAGVLALGGLAALLTIVNWRAVATYGDFIRLVSGVLGVHTVSASASQPLAEPAMPALAVAFVAYIGACACLPWLALVARRFLPGIVPENRWGASGETTLLWDATTAWDQARPALLAASVCMIVAGAVVGVVGVLTSLASRAAAQARGTARGTTHAGVPAAGHLPLALVTADLVVQAALAGLILMLGWAVVRQGVLVERRLPQRGFLGHWRGTVVVAAAVAGMVDLLAYTDAESLPALLLLVVLMAAAYALFTWESYAAHDRFLTQLRPFVDSLASGAAGRLAAGPQDVERAVEALFTSLCRDVLEASRGHLTLTAGHLHRSFTYVASGADGEPGMEPGREWVLPVADERGVVVRLALSPRADGAGYTSADLEVARACGQRILDAVGEFIAVQTVAQLARRRGLEAELTAALPRRKLHDDVLPRLHLAMLQLEALRGRLGARGIAEPRGGEAQAVVAAERSTASASNGVGAVATAEDDARGDEPGAALGEVVSELGGVHRDLAGLLRTAPTANPRRLELGFYRALRAALEGEFRGTFDEVIWDAPDDARTAANGLNDIVADVLLGASLEAIRNASRHARGGDLHRRLSLRVTLAAEEHGVSVTVADDGVGPRTTDAALSTADEGAASDGLATSTRSGLLTHSALLTLIGGSLAVQPGRAGGTVVALRVPLVPLVPDATREH